MFRPFEFTKRLGRAVTPEQLFPRVAPETPRRAAERSRRKPPNTARIENQREDFAC